jgi:hypothetical protein
MTTRRLIDMRAIDTRLAPVGALARFALPRPGGLSGATAQESRPFNAPASRVFTVSHSL